jgi:hypothetical protein
MGVTETPVLVSGQATEIAEKDVRIASCDPFMRFSALYRQMRRSGARAIGSEAITESAARSSLLLFEGAPHRAAASRKKSAASGRCSRSPK